MKKQGLLALALMLVLSACGTPSGSTSSGDNTSSDKPNVTAPESSTPAEKTPLTSGNSATDDLLKTITADTAEAQGICGANLNWYYKDNVLVIKGTGAITEYDNFADVPWNDYRDQINRVIIDEGCTELSNELFSGYNVLSSVFLPDSLTNMGAYVFAECRELVSVQLGNGIASTGKSTFESCEKLETIKLPGSLSAIGDNTFYGCNQLKDIKIPDGVTEIGIFAFDYCENLRSIIIPESVTTIGAFAFGGCSSLTSLTIPENVSTIEMRAFSDCTGLTSLTIPKNVTDIGGGVFLGCENLKNVDVKTPEYILEDNILFDKNKTKIICVLMDNRENYVIPDGVVEVSTVSLHSNWDLHSITFPASVKKIDSDRIGLSLRDENQDYSVIFLGDAPESNIVDAIRGDSDFNSLTIYYSGEGFDEAIKSSKKMNDCDKVFWVKQ